MYTISKRAPAFGRPITISTHGTLEAAAAALVALPHDGQRDPSILTPDGHVLWVLGDGRSVGPSGVPTIVNVEHDTDRTITRVA